MNGEEDKRKKPGPIVISKTDTDNIRWQGNCNAKKNFVHLFIEHVQGVSVHQKKGRGEEKRKQGALGRSDIKKNLGLYTKVSG